MDPDKHPLIRGIQDAIGRLRKTSSTGSYNLLDGDIVPLPTPKRSSSLKLRKSLLRAMDENVYRKQGLSPTTINILSQLPPEWQEEFLPLLKTLHTQEEEIELLSTLWEIFEESSYEKYESYLKADYEHTPVDMQTFIESPEYLGYGKVGGGGQQIFPRLLADACELFAPDSHYAEAIFTGGIGWGKSFLARVAILRMLYELSCLHAPQLFHRLEGQSTIAFINMSLTLTQAMRGVYDEVRKKVRMSPYFRNHFQPDPKVESELRFPKNILYIATTNPDRKSVV